MCKIYLKVLILFSLCIAVQFFFSPWLFSKSSEAGETAFIATADDTFQAGTLASVDTDTRKASKDLLLINPDSVVKSFGKYLYVVQRFGGDSIIVIDSDNPGKVIKEYSTGNGSNPQDIEFI